MRIVVSLPQRDNEFQVLQADEAKTTAARLEADLELLYAEASAVTQIQQLFNAVRSEPRPAAIVVEPVTSNGMETVLRKAALARIGSAVLNCAFREMGALRTQFPDLALFSVSSDQVEIGRIQGQQVRALLPTGGTVLFVHGPQAAVPAQERFRGMKEALEGSHVRLIVVDALWSEESAAAAVKRWVRFKTSETVRLDVVAAQNDAMARGARRALEESPEVTAHSGRIPYLGIDGVPGVGLRLVDEGELSGTVVMPSNTGPAMEQVVAWARSGTVPPPSVVLPVHPYPDLPLMLDRSGRSH
jgi:ABC-type sugar transport system substrate-binding protein